ncbi:MAG: phenylalanine--tRNA ligase subunit beta [Chloroflexi bacterium]|nr:phenylalanine--tRNA ligase subunit beta [Chloroflexota bacterium]
MKVSLRWLSDYVDISVPLEKITERLTLAGLEVSSTEVVGESWEHVFVARVVEVNAHPNADRLRLVTVDLGKQRTTVVCGAPNVAVGQKIAFAKLGARLIDGHSSKVVELKPAKIRGVASEGMVCSEKELGISDSHEGIMVLPGDAPVGKPLAEYLGDTVLDLDITPNRPDCLSVIGIAREVAALTGGKLRLPEVCYQEAGNPTGSMVSVEVVEPALCSRYCASLITGVKIGPSPQWIQQRLLSSGMRPINNIVDVTNYVMLEYGQPLHAFDYSQLRGRKIIVRRAAKGEVITSLDGVERALSPEILVIADGERAVAVAGIMGGLDTEVTENATDILIESANFNQAVIHRGSLALKLSSEASLRFEKGLSRELPLMALKRATQLMAELTGGCVAKGIIDAYPGKQERKPISFAISEVRRLLGMEVGVDEIKRALESLGFDCGHTEDPLQFNVGVPWWRTDVTCAADLVEEVARILGYDNIPTTMLSAPIPERGLNPMLDLRRTLRDVLVNCGFQEVLTYSLTNQEVLCKLTPQRTLAGLALVRVANPMSKDYEYLRTTLRANVLSTLARNQRHQEGGIRIFEIGKIFLPREGALPYEKEMLCGVLSGVERGLSWQGKAEAIDFFAAKGVVEVLLLRLRLAGDFRASNDETLCPGVSADIYVGKEKLGVVGELYPRACRNFDLSDTAFLFEIDLEKLLSLAGKPMKYEPTPRYPSTTRDVALLVDEPIMYQQIYSAIKDFSLISQVTPVDLYIGEQVPSGKKSIAVRIVYQSFTHTLTDEEVDKVQRQILDKLERDLGASLRA